MTLDEKTTKYIEAAKKMSEEDRLRMQLAIDILRDELDGLKKEVSGRSR